MAQSYSEGTHALVNINGNDATVVVHVGGSEIGQGLFTKVAQVVAMTLGCPIEKVRIADNNTDVSPNAAWTGGSTGSEASCEAARLCCVKLNEVLAPVKFELWKRKNAEPSWSDLVSRAKENSLCLSQASNYVPEGKFKTEYRLPWSPFHADYYSFGVAVSEIEVDCLTGEITIIRSDILYDTGSSVNCIIDIGQAEGAFVMGIGYFLREESLISPVDGVELADSTWEYKPPCSIDIPQHFKVELLKDAKFPKGVLGMKGIGEPPMVLAYSVVGALKEAIQSSRKERGLDYVTNLSSPLTTDKIQTSFSLSKGDFVIYLKED
eukprot:TRINITY_DN11701_c0_g1_i1.p1 TRINITY_DN11701_c0_g1~~TRINITY_DN11701_c0_g1_i1.p1  ORF type:complete len:376 (-),score=73.80 TRINITY_DN11701_c0_g1_i1:77-1042(-)